MKKKNIIGITMNAYEENRNIVCSRKADIDLVRDAKPVLGWQNLIFT